MSFRAKAIAVVEKSTDIISSRSLHSASLRSTWLMTLLSHILNLFFYVQISPSFYELHHSCKLYEYPSNSFKPYRASMKCDGNRIKAKWKSPLCRCPWRRRVESWSYRMSTSCETWRYRIREFLCHTKKCSRESLLSKWSQIRDRLRHTHKSRIYKHHKCLRDRRNSMSKNRRVDSLFWDYPYTKFS